ncbi:hypothetical protein M6B38_395210 [Iris pallida]|uniref:Uncharacterized protein n=1 Tax=Iris pallida TaxID=29817 RepID=A0AAX6FXC8_IRIPA|nr:hypothetical protein M6B38_395210 [Iris pallida]
MLRIALGVVRGSLHFCNTTVVLECAEI